MPGSYTPPPVAGGGGAAAIDPRPISAGGDLWMAGVDFPLNAAWETVTAEPAYAYVLAGRVYFGGALERLDGTNYTPWNTLPDELMPYGTASYQECVINFEADEDGYVDTLATFAVDNATGEASAVPASDKTGYIVVWLTNVNYLAAGS